MKKFVPTSDNFISETVYSSYCIFLVVLSAYSYWNGTSPSLTTQSASWSLSIRGSSAFLGPSSSSSSTRALWLWSLSCKMMRQYIFFDSRQNRNKIVTFHNFCNSLLSHNPPMVFALGCSCEEPHRLSRQTKHGDNFAKLASSAPSSDLPLSRKHFHSLSSPSIVEN